MIVTCFLHMFLCKWILKWNPSLSLPSVLRPPGAGTGVILVCMDREVAEITQKSQVILFKLEILVTEHVSSVRKIPT